MPAAVLLLGADQGDPPATFAAAMQRIAEEVGPVLGTSRDHWTEPWGFVGDRLFLNRALLVDIGAIPAREVMHRLLTIERALGRVRHADQRYGPRSIDIDLLFLGEEIIDEEGLQVPHPRVQDRAFALGPAADIVPQLVHPLLGLTVLALLDEVLRRG